MKIAAGLLGNSFALIADGVESVFDVVSSLLVWGGIRASSAPESERYPYGTGKAEPLAALAALAGISVALMGGGVCRRRRLGGAGGMRRHRVERRPPGPAGLPGDPGRDRARGRAAADP
ncbi:MAG: cation transporter [Gemmatimonadota bacterium]